MLLSGAQLRCHAQLATATLDTNNYLIGDWIPLTLEITTPITSNIIWPIIDVNIGDIEVLDRSEVDSSSDGGNKTLSQEFTLTVFDTGFYAIPAFNFLVDNDTLSTLARLIKIEGVAIDSANAPIKDIKSVLGAKLTFKEDSSIFNNWLGCTLNYWHHPILCVQEKASKNYSGKDYNSSTARMGIRSFAEIGNRKFVAKWIYQGILYQIDRYLETIY